MPNMSEIWLRKLQKIDVIMVNRSGHHPKDSTVAHSSTECEVRLESVGTVIVVIHCIHNAVYLDVLTYLRKCENSQRTISDCGLMCGA